MLVHCLTRHVGFYSYCVLGRKRANTGNYCIGSSRKDYVGLMNFRPVTQSVKLELADSCGKACAEQARVRHAHRLREMGNKWSASKLAG